MDLFSDHENMMHIFKMQALFHILLIYVTGSLFVHGEICTKDICEFHFDIDHHRTMTYNKGAVNTFNAKLNGSKVVLEDDEHLRPLPTTDDITDDVITADGVRRNIITVNKMFPGPAIEVMEGSQVVVHVTNHLMTQSITIHWHGTHQEKTPWMDGTAYISHCPILPRQSFTYRFIASPAGTHWYHDHIMGQRSDGLFGLLIVHKRPPPVTEVGLMIMDWFHFDSTTAEITNFYSSIGGAGDYMHPYQRRDYSHDGIELSAFKYVSGLINGRGRFGGNLAPLTTTTIAKGEEVRFRIVNSGAEFYYEVSIDQHTLHLVALDGNEVEPVKMDSFIVGPGERLDFQLTANQAPGNYWLRSKSLKTGVTPQVLPDNGEEQVILAIINYGGVPKNDPMTSPRVCTQLQPCLVFNCPWAGYPISTNKQCIQVDEVHTTLSQHEMNTQYGLDQSVHEEYFLNFGFAAGAGINSIVFAEPRVPLFDPNYKNGMESCDTDQCRRMDAGCKCTQNIVIPYNKTIQFVLSNHIPPMQGRFPMIGHHSIHLHGHSFAVLKMGFPSYNTTTGLMISDNSDVYCDNTFCRRPRWNDETPQLNLNRPPLRDTVTVPARGYVVIRFKSTNPGYWLLHCHMESHALGGMSLLITEAQELIPPAPENVPGCAPFSWSEQQFSDYLTNQDQQSHIIYPTTLKSTTITALPSALPSATTDPRNYDNTSDIYIKKDSVVLDTNIFMALLFGSIAFGFLLAFIPFMVLACRRSNPRQKD